MYLVMVFPIGIGIISDLTLRSVAHRMEENNESALKKLGDEALRKIGRNLLLFQQIEGMLKFLLANGQVQGYASELAAARERNAETVQTQTMGTLVGRYGEVALTGSGRDEEPSGEVKEAWLSFTFKVQGDSTFFETQKAQFAALVADRNDLVHHFLPKWNPSSWDSTHAAVQYLDEQHEKALPVREHLESVIGALQEGIKAHADFMTSEEGRRQFDSSWLRQSRLVILLGDIAMQMGRPDGWTPLSTAGQLVRLHAPEEVSVLKERYGYSNLKQLLLATGVFDVSDEPTSKGGLRTVYRIKPQWTLDIG